nr:hypothetical protein [Prolixibacteraceae bacterium]
LLDFMEITATLLDEPQEQNKQALTQLALSHDHLLATKVASSYITNDKPMLKYLDQKEFYSSETEFNSVVENSQSLEALVINDVAKLQNILLDKNGLGVFSQNTMDAVNSEVNRAINTTDKLSMITFNQAASLGSISEFINSEEKLALINVGDLRGLQNAINNIQGLGSIHSAQELGNAIIGSAQTLKSPNW